MNDRARFLTREYSLMVLDEASAIRNPDTEVARCCFRMKARAKLALTGTPLENSMQDLWSIFQFLQPGYLGERRQFQENYERGASKDPAAAQSLRLRVMPFLLRRTKEEVVKDLPEKVETDDWCDLSPEQAELYQQVWETGLKKIEKLAAAHDSTAHMTLLTLLLRMRQICCDAALVAPELAKTWSLAQRSRKMERLFDLIQGTRESGRKMLVFSQFAKQLHAIEAECQQRGYETLRLDGATRDRQGLVDRFQRDDGPGVFLISLKAGGYGLNLTKASTVVHFDPWWNPAAEQQASDRAHRIGQTQTVNIYKLLTRGTVEERVKNLQASKSQMAAQLFGGSGSQGGLAGMPTMKEIQELLH
jgi:SNF2 family DNA or RNA helicase